MLAGAIQPSGVNPGHWPRHVRAKSFSVSVLGVGGDEVQDTICDCLGSREHREVACLRDTLEVCVEGGGGGAAAADRVDVVFRAPDDSARGAEVCELGGCEAGDAACEELLESGFASLYPEGAFELGQRSVIETRGAWAPGVPQDATHKPVGARDDSVQGGVIRVHNEVGEPGVVAAEGEGVSVEKDDTCNLLGLC